MGVIYGKGFYEFGAIQGVPVVQETYEMGKNV